MTSKQLVGQMACDQALTAYLNAREIKRSRHALSDHTLNTWIRAELHQVRSVMKRIRNSVTPRRWREIIDECRKATAEYRRLFASINTKPMPEAA